MKKGALGAVGMTLALVMAGLGAIPANAADSVTLPDPDLRRCVERNLGLAPGAEVIRDRAVGLKNLNCTYHDLDIDDLTGLEAFTSIRSALFMNGGFSDLTPLTGDSQLTTLEISGSSVTDLTPLAGLPALTTVYLEDTPVADLTPLAGVATLRSLFLHGTALTDAGQLEGFTGLSSVEIGDNPASDFRVLAGLPLSRLIIIDAELSRLDEIGFPASLTSLTLDTPALGSLDGLEAASHLQRLYSGDAYGSDTDRALVDLSALAALTDLTQLYLFGSPITDIEPLAGEPALTELWLSRSRLSDLRPLAGQSALRTLNLDDNQISDLRPLAGLTGLTRLSLTGNAISDLSPLSALTQLKDLELSRNRITSLLPLADLRPTTLWLPGNQISDLTPLKDMSSLEYLYLDGNRVTDPSPVAGLPHLIDVYLGSNQISDLSPFAASPARVSAQWQSIMSPVRATVGVPVPLGIRDRDGTALCFTGTSAATCTDGLVTYPVAGTYSLAFSNASDQPASFSGRISQQAGPYLRFVRTYEPRINGLPRVGTAVRPVTGTWVPRVDHFTYQWFRDGSAIAGPGGTEGDYLSVAADLSHRLSVCVTGHLDGYASTGRCSAPSSKVGKGEIRTSARPTITGTAATDATLTATATGWDDGVTLHYQWQRNRTSIKGATGSTYRVKPGDVGDDLRVKVTGTRPGFASHVEYSRGVHVHRALFTPVVPTVRGEAVVGSTLTADPGAWAPTPAKLAYQWSRNGKAIPRATGTGLVLTAADLGATITVTVTATRPGYCTSHRTSVPFGPVVAA